MRTIKFKYLDEFSCVGPKCTDSCCKHWTILLTKKEYLDYKKLKCEGELKEIMNSAFTREKNGSDNQYARMKLRENGDCPFLGDDSLCMLQKRFGESILTMVCHTYPRLNTRVGNDAIIMTADTTCPHVVELLIKHPEGLALEEGIYGGEDKFINKNLMSGGVVPSNYSGTESFWTLKNMQLDILQNRNFTISERLLILGYFSSKAEKCYKEREKAETLAAAALDNELCRKIADSLRPDQNDDQAGAKSLNILGAFYTVIDRSADKLSSYVKEILMSTLEKLHFTAEYFQEDGREKANYSCDRHILESAMAKYREIESARPYIFENLLVNAAFAQNPIFGIWRNYFALAVYRNIMKALLPLRLPDGFTDAELAQALTDVTKIVMNTHLAENVAYNYFENEGLCSLPYVAFLC